MTAGNSQTEQTESQRDHAPEDKHSEQGEHSKDAINDAAFDDARKLKGEMPDEKAK